MSILVPVLFFFSHHPSQDILRWCVDLGTYFLNGCRIGIDDLPQQHQGTVGHKRHFAAEHLVVADTKRVDVRSAIDLIAHALLRREISRSTPQQAVRSDPSRGVGHKGEAKIGDLEHTSVAQQEVGRFNVAMDHALIVGSR